MDPYLKGSASAVTKHSLYRTASPLLRYSEDHSPSPSLPDTDEDNLLTRQGLLASQHTTSPSSTVHVVTVPSPIMTAPHLKQDSHQSRRFTNNFMDFSPPKRDAVPPKPTVEDNSTDQSSVPPSKESAVSSLHASGVADEKQDKSTTARKPVTAVPEPLMESTSLDQSTKSQKGYAVASRYMSGNKQHKQKPVKADGFKVPTAPPPSKQLLSKTHHTGKQTQLPRTAQVPTPANGGRKQSKSVVKKARVPPVLPPRQLSKNNHTRKQNQHLHDTQEFFQTPVNTLKGVSTSTPLAHDGSYLGDFNAPSTAIKPSKVNKSIIDRDHQIGDLEMELLYDRLIQLTYMDILSYKALKQQETEARNQLHLLWQKVEENKADCFALAKEVEAKERELATDKALDSQSGGLGPLCSKLSLLEREHKAAAQALDATRHDMVMDGTQPLQEDEVEAQLAEAEDLLSSICASVRKKVPGNFSLASETVVEVLDKEYHELDRCGEELSELTRAQVKNTSLYFEQQAS